MPLTVNSPHQIRLKTLADANKDDEVRMSLVGQCQATYELFRASFLDAFSRREYTQMAALLDEYREYAKKLELTEEIVGDRTKYYSSILEEVPILLSRDWIESLITSLGLTQHTLLLGGGECVIRIAANPDGTYFNETKRIDFCLAIDAVGDENWIPLVGLEVKKYCDKTMFGTILETYKSLQIFRPRTFYGFLVEDEARGHDVVLNSPIYQKEFILCGYRDKEKLNPISVPNLERFTVELLKAMDEALNFLARAVAESASLSKKRRRAEK